MIGKEYKSLEARSDSLPAVQWTISLNEQEGLYQISDQRGRGD